MGNRQRLGTAAHRRQLAAPVVLGILIALLSGCDGHGAGAAKASANTPRPNIVFILVDTLRADRLGSYGRAGELSPMMDDLAREGVLFERTIASSSWTLPSVASYFCGLYPTVHKVTSYQEALRSARGGAGRVRYFADEFVTLAEVLLANGYATAGFSANPFITPKYGFAQGFEYFDASFAANETRGDVVNQAAFNWLAQRDRDRPFFMYLHYMDVHDPYKADQRYVNPLIDAVEKLPGKRLLTQAETKRHRPYFSKSAVAYRGSPRHERLFQYAEYWQARYDAGVPQVDQFLTELRTNLVELGLWDDAYVVLTADHGESLGEHLIWAHGLSAHQDQLHVPLILRWPEKLPAGKRIAQTVRLFDILPTLLAQLRLTPVENIQARSLVDLIRGQTSQSLPAFAEAVKRRPGEKALVVDQWKLLAYTDEQRYELYDLDADPTEQHDLAEQLPGKVAQLKQLLEQQMALNAQRGAGVKIRYAEMTPAELERLRALGYITQPDDDPNETEADSATTAESPPEP